MNNKKLIMLKKIEEIASKLTGIKPIEDREYTRLTYVKEGTKHSVSKSMQRRSRLFKSSRKRI